MLALLRLPSKGVGRSFLRVATETIASMYSQQELLSRKYLVCPLIGPLRWLAGGKNAMNVYWYTLCARTCVCVCVCVSLLVFTDSPVDAKEVDGLELQTCLSGLCKVLVCLYFFVCLFVCHCKVFCLFFFLFFPSFFLSFFFSPFSVRLLECWSPPLLYWEEPFCPIFPSSLRHSRQLSSAT